MTKHIIKNYDQVKLRLEQLSKDFTKRSCDYYFAVGDLFNQNIQPGSRAATYEGQGRGMTSSQYSQMLRSEITKLLTETGTEIGLDHVKVLRTTARAWSKDERTFDVPFSVYRYLTAHKDLIRDGMRTTEARVLVASAIGSKGPKRGSFINRTQRLVVTVNQLRGQLKALDDDDESPLTPEEIERIGEAYAILDAYCERKGVSMYEEEHAGGEMVAA